MAKTTVTVRMDEAFKAEAEAEFAQLGVSHTDVIHGTYGYIIMHHRLPYASDAEALATIKSRLAEAADLATNLGRTIGSRREFGSAESQSVVALLNRFTMELESNWLVLKRARGGFLPERWHEALAAAKGLSYLLAMTWERAGAKLPAIRSYREPDEIVRACEVLTTRNAAIQELD